MTKSQRRLQGIVIFSLSILLILGSLLTALAEDRYSDASPAPTSPVLRSATPQSQTTSSTKVSVVSPSAQQPSPTPLPATPANYEISFE